MRFASKNEAISYALLFVGKLPKSKHVKQCIEKLMRAYDNHEQDVNKICSSLQSLLMNMSGSEEAKLLQLIRDIQTGDYQQSLQKKFENPLARLAESELFSSLLCQPTEAMMGAVRAVSLEIIGYIN